MLNGLRTTLPTALECGIEVFLEVQLREVKVLHQAGQVELSVAQRLLSPSPLNRIFTVNGNTFFIFSLYFYLRAATFYKE